jgi:hypothetical protein
MLVDRALEICDRCACECEAAATGNLLAERHTMTLVAPMNRNKS